METVGFIFTYQIDAFFSHHYFKDIVTIGSMVAEFQIFNTEGMFSIVRMLFNDLRVDNDRQPPQQPPKSQIEGPIFLTI